MVALLHKNREAGSLNKITSLPKLMHNTLNLKRYNPVKAVSQSGSTAHILITSGVLFFIYAYLFFTSLCHSTLCTIQIAGYIYIGL